MSDTFCPATMCPLVAAEGSPWTGDKNAKCDGPACGWYDDGRCFAAGAAHEQISDVQKHGGTFQVGPKVMRLKNITPRTYDCARATECQWQVEAGQNLCPPRRALSLGIDPKACSW